MLNIRGNDITPKFMASHMDLALLGETVTKQDVDAYLQIAKEYEPNSFNVEPNYLEYIVKELDGYKTTPSCVVDYPMGLATRNAKLKLTEEYIRIGAKAVDIVIDFGAVKNGNWKLLREEVADFVKAAQGNDTKIIIECHLLTDDEIIAMTKIIEEEGGSYVKTGTGRMTGPDYKDIMLIRDTLSPNSKTKIKFSGTGQFWNAVIAINGYAAGADLIGTRAVKQIIDELATYERVIKEFKLA